MPAPLERKEHGLLLAALNAPYLLQTELGERCGVRGRELTHVRDALVERDLLRVHRLGRSPLWEVTDAGAALLGRSPQQLGGVGQYGHRWVQARITAWLNASLSRVVIEHRGKEGAFDVYGEAADGAKTAVEVVLSLDTLSRALEKLANFNGRRLIIVADTAAAKKLRRRVSSESLWAADETLEVMTVGELIKASKGIAATGAVSGKSH